MQSLDCSERQGLQKNQRTDFESNTKLLAGSKNFPNLSMKYLILKKCTGKLVYITLLQYDDEMGNKICWMMY